MLFTRQDSVGDWQSWREMHPILLRSTGLVGLAVAVVAIVSDQSFVSEPHAQTQPQIVVAAVRAQPVDAAVGTPETAVLNATGQDRPPRLSCGRSGFNTGGREFAVRSEPSGPEPSRVRRRPPRLN
jgi:hypothetical protein